MPDESKLIYLTDRSGAETDDTCGMRFWFNRKAGAKKRGIVPKEEAEALAIGRTIHEDMVTIGEMPDLRAEAVREVIEDILQRIKPDTTDVKRMEILYRRLGWIAAWALFLEPVVRQHWETLHIEHEMILDRDPLYVAFTPDRLLRHKVHNYTRYMEYKSTITAQKKWIDSWPYAIQIHIGLAGVKEEYPEYNIKYATVVGMMKGSRSMVDHRLIHPYVWGWYNRSTNKWTHKYDEGRKAGYEQMPIWEHPDGLVNWVLTCGDECARLQFPHTAPIFLNETMLNGWVERRMRRETEIHLVDQSCREDFTTRQVHFPQISKQCRPAFGDSCPYLRGCWVANYDIENDEDFVERTPHHDVEIVGIE